MKNFICIVVCLMFSISLFGQEKPEHDKLNLVTMQLGIGIGIYESAGVNATLSFEKKLRDKPFSFYANYTLGSLYNDTYDENIIFNDKSIPVYEFSLVYNHFGGGVHYFPLNYNRSFKPYVGLGGFVGFNRHSFTVDVNEDINDSGMDFGGYGTFGIRWMLTTWSIGFEHRLGYIQTEILGEKKSSALSEFVCTAVFKF